MLGGKNKQQHRPLGYTIVEIMIVLAVSGFMFVIAANFINGKQERAAFAQGSNDVVSLLQNVVEDITDGHYSDVPINCTASGSAISFPSGSSPGQGANPDCVFLGKLARFYAAGGSGLRDHYAVYSIAAARSLSGTLPSALVGAIPGLTTNSTTPQSLYVQKMNVVDTGNPPSTHTDVYNIGFVQGLGSTNAANGVYQSGAQQPVGLVFADINNPASWSEGDVAGTVIRPAKSATICLSDGTRYAVILVGGAIGNDNQLSISVKQFGTTNPGAPLCN